MKLSPIKSGIKTAHGTLWAEGITRSGRHVLTTTSQVSSLTQVTDQSNCSIVIKNLVFDSTNRRQ